MLHAVHSYGAYSHLVSCSSCAMKYSNLAPLLLALVRAFGACRPGDESQFQEECAGDGHLTAGVRLMGIMAARRDVA